MELVEKLTWRELTSLLDSPKSNLSPSPEPEMGFQP